MSFTVDWENKIVNSDQSITDIPATRQDLRALEDSEIGILYAPIIAYKKIDLGGGAIFPAIEFINGYQLKFPNSGNYFIKGGNLLASIVPVPSVFIDRTQSAAYTYSVIETGTSGLTKEESDKLFAIENIDLTPIMDLLNIILESRGGYQKKNMTNYLPLEEQGLI